MTFLTILRNNHYYAVEEKVFNILLKKNTNPRKYQKKITKNYEDMVQPSQRHAKYLSICYTLHAQHQEISGINKY